MEHIELRSSCYVARKMYSGDAVIIKSVDLHAFDLLSLALLSFKETKFCRSYTMLSLSFILSSLAFFHPALGQSLRNERTVYGWLGESVTLTCAGDVDDGYPIVWLRPYQLESNHRYLSTDNEVYDNVPDAIKRRLSVECQRGTNNDICRLTINRVTGYDSGTYHCNYYNDVTFTHDVLESLDLLVGSPPSKMSPICQTFEIRKGEYIPSDAYENGDEVRLHCLVEDSTINPSLDWIRENRTSKTIVTQSKDHRLIYGFFLTENDVGAVFTCVMRHPGLPVRNCSVTPLPAPPTTSPKSAARGSISDPINPLVTTAENAKIGNTVTDSNITFLLPMIIAIIVLIATVIAVVVVMLLVQNRKKHNANPSKPHYKSYDQDRSTTAEYAVVNTKTKENESTVAAERSATGTIDITDEEEACSLYAKPDQRKKSNDISVEIDDSNISTAATYAAVNAPDSIDNPKNTKGNPPEDSNVAGSGSSGTAEEDTCPLYAKPDKIIKSNDVTVTVEDHNENDNFISCKISDQPADAGDDDGLMYADLDLTRTPESESARMPPIDPDTTVYADVKRVL